MRHHENLNLTNEEGANLVSHLGPAVPARIPPPLPGISHQAPLWKKREGVKGPPQTPRLWWWVTLCKAFVGDLRGAAARKQVVKSGTASQCSGGEVCLQTAPSSIPEPQPRPSDVCVSPLMKKFWYLGETLLSAEQPLPSPCPQPLHSHTATPPNRNPIRPLASPSLLWKELLKVGPLQWTPV